MPDSIDPKKIPSVDEALEEYDSKFRYVLLAATRAEQIVSGARPKIEMTGAKPTRFAMEEFRRSLVEWDYGPPPAEEPAEGEAADETAAEPEEQPS